MSISLLSSAYLEENSARIRSKLVPWEGYQRAELITLEELAAIKKVDRQPKAKCEAVLLSEGRTYALLYLNLLKKLQRVDTMQCLLILITDALQDHDERIPLFLKASQIDPDLPYAPLLRALEAQDEFVQLKTAQILTVFLSAEPAPLPTQYLQPFLTILSSFIQGPSSNKRDTSVQCLETLLSRQACRQEVWRIPNIIAGFMDILKRSPGNQMSYQVSFCLWLLSFEQNIAEQINKKFDIIPILVETAQSALKEKVIRVIVATFRNLVTKAPSQNLPAMLVCQLLPFVKNLATRKFSDEDIIEDVLFLKDELNSRFQSLTTYDEYTSELASGHLSWTPVHESDDFWKENATKLNDKDHEQLKILIKVLKESSDPIVLAVAAHDVGQYVRHYGPGKKSVADLGGKARVMELMTHPNSDVRYRALLSVQQLISQPWLTV
ncbi:V-type proton ATPase subunit H [Psilocybe cubensis]|uniref:V-type proton ATPase subunit H n=2 Tax=Psilocybe cubensis TaxID=181762 RepID=A0ACB8H7C1_PSICU|nr:V-type proton ATPase subunit H [Psilocybe cubensis]KAH9483833.1 V-type proton ATPase subunit H [Psilocybe cubensis]